MATQIEDHVESYPKSKLAKPGFKESAPSKYLPNFPQCAQDLFTHGAVIEGTYLASISDIGQAILLEIENWKAETETGQWPNFADNEIAAFRRTYQRMENFAEGQPSQANTADVRKLAKAYFIAIRSNDELYQRFLQGQLTLYNLKIDFANTIACGGTLQTTLEWYV
ncbi:MAG: hypothetical protein P8103_11875 [Candidatus Thiodiazotropha sp.]